MVENLEEYVENVSHRFKLDQQGYSQEYGMINHGILQALMADGFVTRREGGLGYDMSALNDNRDAIALAARVGKELAYDKVRSMYAEGEFDGWDDVRQEVEVNNHLAFTTDKLASTIKTHGDMFSDQAMLSDYKQTIQFQLGTKKDIYMGGLSGDDSKDIFKDVFGWKESQPRWNKVKWDVLEGDDEKIRDAVFNNIMGTKIDASYMKGQGLYNM
jgi:hypothetical protein